MTRISGGTPSLFGYTIQRVTSGSMVPTFEVGDVILCKGVDDPSTLQKGDIITFRGGEEFEYNLVTHRVQVPPYEEDGRLCLRTKGDANKVADSPIPADTVFFGLRNKAQAAQPAL